MENLIIKFVKTYQKVPGKFHNYCRHIPTCSNYMIEAIEEHGSFKGSFMGIKRVLKCNPLFKPGIDLVPKKKEKKE